MILCDTGVIVAAINAADGNHARCSALLNSIRVRLITTWPCITEAMYLLGTQAGAQAQEILRKYIERWALIMYEATQEDAERACVLMRKYQDTPMDFADASLVAAAEVLNITQILTLVRHFYAYRINGKTPFEVRP